MSIHAVSWALQQPVNSPAMKLVLICLADAADAEWTAWPHLESLCENTTLERKAVMAAIDGLERKKLIADTGRRRGDTNRIKVYLLNPCREVLSVDAPLPSKGKPLSVAEVIEFGASIGMPERECKQFYDYFESNGWLVGGRARMKDWKAACRRWNRTYKTRRSGGRTKSVEEMLGL